MEVRMDFEDEIWETRSELRPVLSFDGVAY